MIKTNQPTKKGNMKTYRVEVKALAYFDIDANSKEQALKEIPQSFNHEIGNNGQIFYEQFDYNKATVKEQ